MCSSRPPTPFMKMRWSEFCWPQGVSGKFVATHFKLSKFTILTLNQNFRATFHVINCHQNKKNKFIYCRELLKMSVVLQVSTYISFWTRNFLRALTWLQKNINQGALICKELTGVRKGWEMTSSWWQSPVDQAQLFVSSWQGGIKAKQWSRSKLLALFVLTHQ